MDISGIPEFSYLDESKVENYLNIIGGTGSLVEVVQHSEEHEESSKQGGFSKILSMNISSKSGEREFEELKKELNGVGKFALLHESIDNLKKIEDDVKNLEQGDFILLEGEIEKTPIAEVTDLFSQFSDIIKAQAEQESQVKALIDVIDQDSLLMIERDAFDSRFVFEVGQRNITDPSFPVGHKEYSIVGRVDYIYEEEDEESMLEILDEIPQELYEDGQGKKDILDDFAGELSGKMSQDIERSDMTLTKPDMKITPIAIYRFG